VVIKLDLKETSETDLSKGKNQIIDALETNPVPNKRDLNNRDRVGFAAVRDSLLARDPMHAEPAEYERQARRVLDFIDKEHGGVIRSLDELKGAVPVAVTLNVAVCPTVTVWFAGCAVIVGATAAALTVSVTIALVTLPAELLTTTSNFAPLSPATVAGVV